MQLTVILCDFAPLHETHLPIPYPFNSRPISYSTRSGSFGYG
jgi:hypothetical protein